ncbi:MAG: hypothetical protein DMF71_14250 [Acidobacteria bacterium]|nr:MAG: hypothetical protein DMF71_14250 [Acidobacteriota bacterium]
METATVTNGKSTGFKFEHLTARAAEGKILAEDLVEIGKHLDETTHYIKHHPWQSVGVALGVGLSLGFLSGFLSRRS